MSLRGVQITCTKRRDGIAAFNASFPTPSGLGMIAFNAFCPLPFGSGIAVLFSPLVITILPLW